MTDLEKIKIDILRDSLKDAIDTIRALDKKIILVVLGLQQGLSFL